MSCLLSYGLGGVSAGCFVRNDHDAGFGVIQHGRTSGEQTERKAFHGGECGDGSHIGRAGPVCGRRGWSAGPNDATNMALIGPGKRG